MKIKKSTYWRQMFYLLITWLNLKQRMKKVLTEDEVDLKRKKFFQFYIIKFLHSK